MRAQQLCFEKLAMCAASAVLLTASFLAMPSMRRGAKAQDFQPHESRDEKSLGWVFSISVLLAGLGGDVLSFYARMYLFALLDVKEPGPYGVVPPPSAPNRPHPAGVKME